MDQNNKYYSDIDGVLFNKEKDTLLVYPEKRQNKVYNIPSGVKTISSAAFNNAQLDEIIISEDVELIGESAFSLSKIKKITVPGNVKKIEMNCFACCDELEEVVLEEGLTHIAEYVFHSCEKLKKLEIPNTVTYIGVGILDGCNNLEYIIIPESVKTINSSIWKSNTKKEAPFVLYVAKDSYAEEYAKEYGYQYKYYDFENKCVIE